jgi:hypothetical protein
MVGVEPPPSTSPLSNPKCLEIKQVRFRNGKSLIKPTTSRQLPQVWVLNLPTCRQAPLLLYGKTNLRVCIFSKINFSQNMRVVSLTKKLKTPSNKKKNQTILWLKNAKKKKKKGRLFLNTLGKNIHIISYRTMAL